MNGKRGSSMAQHCCCWLLLYSHQPPSACITHLIVGKTSFVNLDKCAFVSNFRTNEVWIRDLIDSNLTDRPTVLVTANPWGGNFLLAKLLVK